jgi:hypothetical protein
MIDWIQTYSRVGSDTIKQVESQIVHLSKVELTKFGLTYHNGYVSNPSTGRKLGVSYNYDNETMSVKVCPNKFLLGNNVQEASIRDVNFLFADLGDMFSYDFGEATVKRLDITHTAQTELVPMAYYPFMCHQKTFFREEKNTSLYYKQQGFTKLFYDKVNEVDKRKTWGGKQKIPQKLQGKNLFRFEMRLNSPRRVSNAIGIPTTEAKPTLYEVVQDSSIELLQELWLKEYNNIDKMTELPYDFTNKKGAKQTIKEIMEVALCQTGRLNIEKLIIQAENCGAITTKKERYDARKVLDVFKTRASKSNLIMELDDKIKSCEPKLT